MNEVIDSVAIQVPDQEKLDQFNTLSAEEQKSLIKQVAEMQSIAADAVLRGDKCFDILKEMYVNCANLIMTTSAFVIPTKAQLDNVCKSLSDPEGFKRSFGTLCNDIFTYNQNMTTLYSFHCDRTGAPTEEEVTDVFSLADGYNKLLSHYENAIEPLMTTLAQVIEKEHNPSLEKELNAIA